MKELIPTTRVVSVIIITGLLMLAATSGNAQIGPNLPDLVVQEVRISPESPTPGEIATITLVVANQGNVDAQGPFDVDFQISFGPQELAEIGLGFLVGIRIDKKIVTGRIRPNSTIEVSFNWEVLQLPRFELIFLLDSPFNRIQESDENNNRTEHILEIEESQLTQWWLDNINVEQAWEITRGLPTITVAVIDTGIDIEHPEFQGNLWVNPADGSHGFDFIDNTNGLTRTSALDFHGTSVGGLIAAKQDGLGISGVAPNVRLMDLRVFPTTGGATFGNITRAIQFATVNGADVINLSLGTSFCSIDEIDQVDQFDVQRSLDSLENAVRFAVTNDVIVVSSAGNNARCVGFPANFDGVIAVSSTTIDNNASGFTSFGPEVEFAAPGGSLSREDFFDALRLDFNQLVPVLNTLLVTPYLDNNYGWFTGTSASSPIVSGVVALMLSVNPNLRIDQVRDVLAATALDLGRFGRDDLFGSGLVDAGAAVQCVENNLDCL